MYDRIKADKAVRFIEKLKHTKGKFYGQNFTLLPWEREVIEKLFGTMQEDGFRQYRTAYVSTPKKNGKTELSAALGLKCLLADGEMGGEVYCCATDRDQASMVFDVAAEMVRQNKVLLNHCKINESRKRIVVHSTNSFFQVLSSESRTKHGLNPSCIIFDELHAQPDDKLWNVMTYDSQVARTQPILFIITTAGNDKESICYKQYQYAKKVQAGLVDDSHYLPIIYEADQKDDWNDRKVWEKANPSLGITMSFPTVKASYDKAKEIPSEENLFRQYRLNQWTSQVTRWIPMDTWFSQKEPVDEAQLLGQTCWGGLDLSSVSDITSYALLFKDGNKIKTITRCFIPEETMSRKEREDQVPYSSWEKLGYIIKTRGNRIDYDMVKKWMFDDAKKYHIKRVGFDPWNATQLVQDLMDEGIEMVEVRQGFKSLNPPSKEFEVLVMGGNYVHGNNPVLSNHLDNVTLEIDAAGNIKPSKSKSTQKIDALVANIIALAVVDKDERSVYEDRGILSL